MPSALTTDGAFHYGEALKNEADTLGEKVVHIVCSPIERMRVDLHPGNNVAEALNSRQRDMTRDFRGLVKGPGARGYLDSAQELMDGIRAHSNLVQRSLALPGGRTPAEAAGLSAPVIPGYNRLVSMVAVGKRRREEAARATGPSSEQVEAGPIRGPEP